jgi:hypothetical protein
MAFTLLAGTDQHILANCPFSMTVEDFPERNRR